MEFSITRCINVLLSWMMFNAIYIFIMKFLMIRGYTNIAKPTFVSRYVSCFHSFVLCSICSLYLLKILPPDHWKAFQSFPLAYCIYDSMLITLNRVLRKEVSRVILVHHLFFFLSIIFLIEDYTFEVSLGYLSEISNIPLHISYHFIKTGKDKTNPTAFLFFSTFLVLTFFLFRICVFSYLFLLSLNLSLTGVLCTIFFLSINIHWFRLLLIKYIEIS